MKEVVIEIGKTEESLELFYCLGSWPGLKDFSLIHLDAFLTDPVTN